MKKHTPSCFLSFQKGVKKTSPLTSVGVVQEDELVPVVVVEEGQESPADGWPELQGELALALGGEAGSDERDVQGAAEGRQRVDWALVVQAEDGKDAAGVLGTNWGGKHNKDNKDGLINKKIERVETGKERKNNNFCKLACGKEHLAHNQDS